MPRVDDISLAHKQAKRRQAALKAWDKRGRKKDRLAGAGPVASRGDWTAERERVKNSLATSPIAKTKDLGGGITETYKLTTADGISGCFKVGPGIENEVAAGEVAGLVGMGDMVNPAVIREVDVPGYFGLRQYEPGRKKGSFAAWQEGEEASKAEARGGDIFDGAHDLQRAAMFDWITGNADRHHGNWVMSRDGKVKLIDHNFSFSTYHPYSEFFKRLKETMPRGQIASFAAPYIAKKAQILDRLARAGLKPDQIRACSDRIDRAATATTWAELFAADNRD